MAALTLAFAAVVATASPAAAHDALIGADPADGSTVAALPAQITLTFSADIAGDPGASEVQVTDASGADLADGTPTVSDNVLTQPVAGDASGVVTVLWKVVSSDGHPTSGQLTFTVEGAPAPAPTESATAAPTPTTSAEPTEAPTPTQSGTPATTDEDSTFADVWPWVVIGILLAGAAGAVIYLLVSRARRENALGGSAEEGAQDAAGQGPSAGAAPGSGPDSDH
ncbi:copper resistance CopC family protein [Microbacterium jejuense]|uniref:copper resistance CopC family protein n=1 Tax=Microbacterium jejuense TaxID=1263637 RepID=UPI0027E390D7|nr:copper resistance protein CopC [Microbacterium jejuense]